MYKCTFIFDFLLSTWLWGITIGTSWLLFVPIVSCLLLYLWFKERFFEAITIPILIEVCAIVIHTLILGLLSNFYTSEELLFNQQHHIVNYIYYSTAQLLFLYLPLQLSILYIFSHIPLKWARIHINFSRQAYALILSCVISTFLSYQFIRLGLVGG